MKKLLLVAVLMSSLAGVSMAQAHPSKKTSSTKTETKRDSVGGATASHMGKHKVVHKKGAHKNS